MAVAYFNSNLLYSHIIQKSIKNTIQLANFSNFLNIQIEKNPHVKPNEIRRSSLIIS